MVAGLANIPENLVTKLEKQSQKKEKTIMGYVHDTASSMLTQLSSITATVGTWAMTVASHIWTLNKTAAADTSVLKIPLILPGNAAALKGAYLKSIDIWWINATANLNDITAALYTCDLPAQAGTQAVANPTLTYDTAHATSAQRYTQAQHQMTMTLSTPFWVDQGRECYLELTVNAAATSAIKLQAVRSNYTLRL